MKKRFLIKFLLFEILICVVFLCVYFYFALITPPNGEALSSGRASFNAPDAVPAAPVKAEILNAIVLPDGLFEAVAVKNTATVAFAGDVLLDRGVKNIIYNEGFEGVITGSAAQVLKDADVAMVNMEFCMSERGAPQDKEYTFRADPAHIGFFEHIGADIVTLANNHILDYGEAALSDTLEILDRNGVKRVGAGADLNEAARCETFSVNGLTIAFLGASRVLADYSWFARPNKAGVFAAYDAADLLRQIKTAKSEADFVVVYIHWGVERNETPEPYQTDAARAFINAGADAVVGAHPHVLQGIEFYDEKPIIYSLGNFVFTDAKKDSMAVTVTFEKNAAPTVRVTPFEIKNLRTLPIADPERIERFRNHLREISFNVLIDNQFNVYSNGHI